MSVIRPSSRTAQTCTHGARMPLGIAGSGHGRGQPAPLGKCNYMERLGVSGRPGYRWEAGDELSRSLRVRFEVSGAPRRRWQLNGVRGRPFLQKGASGATFLTAKSHSHHRSQQNSSDLGHFVSHPGGLRARMTSGRDRPCGGLRTATRHASLTRYT